MFRNLFRRKKKEKFDEVSVPNAALGTSKSRNMKEGEEDAQNKSRLSSDSRVHYAKEFDETVRCRICMDLGDDPNQEMVIPCKCTGSIKYVHVNCLKQWIKSKQSLVCEICHRPYKNKWKLWALENKVLNSQQNDVTTDNLESLGVLGLKLLPIFYLFFIIFAIISYNIGNYGLSERSKSKKMNVAFRVMFFLLVIATIGVSYIWFTKYKKFRDIAAQYKRELLQALPPRNDAVGRSSNNIEIADSRQH
eukprot:TRINITY_DN2348_c0_g1_i1.p1 TRINITY_DN2348_c0_g1~~TRINITY_DN2348_c0_g1_i1.p1  ORF type:complete len:249 (-),score=38.60 TRINITY_DN2348_c0_g1_i1:80-826(-)